MLGQSDRLRPINAHEARGAAVLISIENAWRTSGVHSELTALFGLRNSSLLILLLLWVLTARLNANL